MVMKSDHVKGGLLFLILFSSFVYAGEAGVNFLKLDELNGKKYIYFFPMYCGPGVWDHYLQKNAGKISSEVFKGFIKDQSNREFFKQFPLRIRNGVVWYWKLKKTGIDLYNYSYLESTRIPTLLGRKRAIYLFPKIKLFKFNRKNRIALLKVFFYMFDFSGNLIGRHRIKVIIKNGDFDLAYNEVRDAPEVERLKIPMKYIILLKLINNSYSDFFTWLSGVAGGN